MPQINCPPPVRILKGGLFGQTHIYIGYCNQVNQASEPEKRKKWKGLKCLDWALPGVTLGSPRSHISLGITHWALPGAAYSFEIVYLALPDPYLRLEQTTLALPVSKKLLCHSRARKSYSGTPGSTSIQVTLDTTTPRNDVLCSSVFDSLVAVR